MDNSSQILQLTSSRKWVGEPDYVNGNIARRNFFQNCMLSFCQSRLQLSPILPLLQKHFPLLMLYKYLENSNYVHNIVLHWLCPYSKRVFFSILKKVHYWNCCEDLRLISLWSITLVVITLKNPNHSNQSINIMGRFLFFLLQICGFCGWSEKIKALLLLEPFKQTNSG